MEKTKHEVTQTYDMPIAVNMARELSYGMDFLKFSRENPHAALIQASTEREVLDDRMDRMGNNIGTMIKLIGVGMMGFILIMGIVIAYQVMVKQGTGTQQPSGAPPGSLLAMLLFVPWRKHEHLPDVQ